MTYPTREEIDRMDDAALDALMDVVAEALAANPKDREARAAFTRIGDSCESEARRALYP
jgi:hypothetical protein